MVSWLSSWSSWSHFHPHDSPQFPLVQLSWCSERSMTFRWCVFGDPKHVRCTKNSMFDFLHGSNMMVEPCQNRAAYDDFVSSSTAFVVPYTSSFCCYMTTFTANAMMWEPTTPSVLRVLGNDLGRTPKLHGMSSTPMMLLMFYLFMELPSRSQYPLYNYPIDLSIVNISINYIRWCRVLSSKFVSIDCKNDNHLVHLFFSLHPISSQVAVCIWEPPNMTVIWVTEIWSYTNGKWKCLYIPVYIVYIMFI